MILGTCFSLAVFDTRGLLTHMHTLAIAQRRYYLTALCMFLYNTLVNVCVIRRKKCKNLPCDHRENSFPLSGVLNGREYITLCNSLSYNLDLEKTLFYNHISSYVVFVWVIVISTGIHKSMLSIWNWMDTNEVINDVSVKERCVLNLQFYKRFFLSINYAAW